MCEGAKSVKRMINTSLCGNSSTLINGDALIMGRPIQKKWFGSPVGAGTEHITVNGVRFADGTTATNAYIVKQTGSAAYIVQDVAKTHAAEIVFMVNANAVSALLPSQCFILATPFGGSAKPCYKIAQFRVDIFDVANTVPRETGAPVPDHTTSYSWSTFPAAGAGSADLITGPFTPGVITSVTLVSGGAGYFIAPAVSFGGGGTGATATATVTNGVVTALALGAGGTGYASGSITIASPPASVTATGTATVTTGAVTAGVVTVQGGYYTSAPAVIVSGDGTGATATATVTAGHVTAITITAGGAGYTAATLSIAAPPAATQATGTATVSV